MKNKYLTLGDKCFTYYTSRSIHWMCSKKKELLKILQNSKGNTYFRESFFNKVAGLKGYNFILKKLEHRCFPVNFARFSRTTSLQNTFKLLHCTKNDFFSKCDQIRSFLRIQSHLLKKSLIENFIFCAVLHLHFFTTGAVRWHFFTSDNGDPMLVVSNTKSIAIIFTFDPLRGLFKPTKKQGKVMRDSNEQVKFVLS